MCNTPAAAVLLATYNGEKYIEELLQSLVDQTYSNFRCYIHDDGSKDTTVEICRKFADSYPDKFIILDYPSAGGAKNNFLSLMSRVSEEYILFCDQDDVWAKDKIQKSVDKIIEAENGNHNVPALVFTDLQIVNADLSVREPSYLKYIGISLKSYNRAQLLFTGIVPGCAFIINKCLLDYSMKYEDASAIFMHDWWSMLVLYASGGVIDFVDEPLIMYRQHGDNCVGVVKLNFFQRVIKNLKQLFTGKSNKKDKMAYIKKQLIELSKLPDINYENRSFLNRFAEINNKCRLTRMIFYIRYFHSYKLLFWLLFG